MTLTKNTKELKAARIKLKKSYSHRLRDVSFSSSWFYAELRLPEMIVDETTAATFLNLVAYEMCPDFRNNYEICSFVDFMDSLIDHPGDVKELRSAKILLNALMSKEVAKIFNFVSTYLVSNMKGYSL
ncbi:hypothetical protein D0Y65_050764 [Glycine soja]|uniref:Uncharacterized protein n=1 Tax=Glycine soja TaxID=3848 RepID=A0A445FDF2_GLYSO|nr:hypothetical protein D0Y65_050764 [Glycine soja]